MRERTREQEGFKSFPENRLPSVGVDVMLRLQDPH